MTEENTPQPEEDTPQEPPERVAKVQSFPNGWHLVTCGTWQISVGADGLIMLPRHLHPGEVEDFCTAAVAAAQVGAKVVEENFKGLKPVGPLPSGGPLVTEGPPPPGYVRMPITPRGSSPQERAATIGRTKRQQRDPRQPRVPQQPSPPIPGVRNGR
jgi:hypothetical protein